MHPNPTADTATATGTGTGTTTAAATAASAHNSDAKRPPALGLRERGRRERFARILAAAETLFAAKGYDDVTTKEVAQRAKVGEATLFRYISHKSDLLMLVIGNRQDALLDELMAADDAAHRQQPDPLTASFFAERITRIYRTRIEFFILDPEHVAKYVSVGFQSDSELGASSINSGDRVITRVSDIIAAGQTAGVIRNDFAPRIIARNLNAAYIHEVLRTPARALPVEGTWERLAERLDVMLLPLLITS